MPYIVKSPVEGYNGISAGVQFKDGVAKTDNVNAADWLKSHGYEVTENKPDKQGKTPETPQPETPQPEVTQPETPQPEALQPETPPQPEAPTPKAPENAKGGRKGGK